MAIPSGIRQSSTTIITHSCGIESRQPLYNFLGCAAEAYQGVDKIHLAIVTEEHIVTMRSNIRDGHHPVSKEISILSDKSPLREQRLNLSFRRECFCPHGILSEHHTNRAKFKRDADEFVGAFGEKYVVNDMLVYPVRLRSVLERHQLVGVSYRPRRYLEFGLVETTAPPQAV